MGSKHNVRVGGMTLIILAGSMLALGASDATQSGSSTGTATPIALGNILGSNGVQGSLSEQVGLGGNQLRLEQWFGYSASGTDCPHVSAQDTTTNSLMVTTTVDESVWPEHSGQALFIMSSSGLTGKQTAVSASDNNCVEGPPLWSVVETITVSQPSTCGASGDVDGDGLDDLLTAANGYQGLNGTAASISEAAVNHAGGTTSWRASSSGVTGTTPPPSGTTGAGGAPGGKPGVGGAGIRGGVGHPNGSPAAQGPAGSGG